MRASPQTDAAASASKRRRAKALCSVRCIIGEPQKYIDDEMAEINKWVQEVTKNIETMHALSRTQQETTDVVCETCGLPDDLAKLVTQYTMTQVKVMLHVTNFESAAPCVGYFAVLCARETPTEAANELSIKLRYALETRARMMIFHS